MTSFVCYIIYSSDLDKYYVGHTADMNTRIKKHLTQHKGYTATAKDWKIVFLKSFKTKNSAYEFERKIKKMKSKKYIEKIIQSLENEV
jgi:putative endonuclease